MTYDQIKERVLRALPSYLVVELADRLTQEAQRAFEMVRDGSDGLKGRAAAELVGQARFRLMERGFSAVCAANGGLRLEGDKLPGKDVVVFQPFFIFGDPDDRVVLALASMPEPTKVPAKNRSRRAGVTLNAFLTPQLDLDGQAPKPGDVFVLFLVARDPLKAGAIEEMAIGVVDGTYSRFILYIKIEDFLAAATPAEDTSPPVMGFPLTLKRPAAEFGSSDAPKEKPDDARGDV